MATKKDCGVIQLIFLRSLSVVEGIAAVINSKVTSTALSQLARGLMSSLLLIFSLTACSDKEISEEDQIKAVVEKAIIAAEKKELGKLVDIMAENYSDQYNKDRKQAGKLLRVYFFRNKSIHLFTSIKSIQILDDETQQNADQKRAVLQIYVGLAGRPIKDKSALGVRADLLLFTMDMVKDGDDWLVEKADWKRASQSDL